MAVVPMAVSLNFGQLIEIESNCLQTTPAEHARVTLIPAIVADGGEPYVGWCVGH